MALVAGGNRVDVSQEATWTSSNPAVVTAAAGALTATGPGTAEIQVTYRGITQRVTVTARRNTTIGGLLIMRQAETDFIRLNNTSLLIDGRNVGGGGSDHGGYRRLSMLFGWAPNIEKSRHSMFDLPPGDYEMTVRVVEPWALTSTQPFTIYNDTDESWAVLSDRDTDEILGSVVFPRRQVTLTGPGEMTLPFSVPAFTN